ncbi:MAG: phage replisome organizer N-terminal domain-containing protein [bacterium]|nr:phage replisome organizer N-terminal domain-containing protein [bacterium]
MDWFKVHHGLTYDARLGAVARRSGLTRAEAVCLLLCLLEHASRSLRRGSVDGFDTELSAALFDRDVAKVEAAMAALRDKGMIDADNRIADWERQGLTQAERQRAYRARKRAAEERQQQADERKQKKPRHNDDAIRVDANDAIRVDPDNASETLARRKRLSAQAIERSTARRNSTEGAAP